MQVTFSNPTPNGAVPAVNCSPAPCASVQGYTLWVSSLKIEGDLVSMQVTFKNASSGHPRLSGRPAFDRFEPPQLSPGDRFARMPDMEPPRVQQRCDLRPDERVLPSNGDSTTLYPALVA